MQKFGWISVVAVAASFLAMPVAAAETTVTGTIVQTQGHVSPSCRMVQLKTTSGVSGQLAPCSCWLSGMLSDSEALQW